MSGALLNNADSDVLLLLLGDLLLLLLRTAMGAKTWARSSAASSEQRRQRCSAAASSAGRSCLVMHLGEGWVRSTWVMDQVLLLALGDDQDGAGRKLGCAWR